MKTIKLKIILIAILVSCLTFQVFAQDQSNTDKPLHNPKNWTTGGLFDGFQPENEDLTRRTEYSKFIRIDSTRSALFFVAAHHLGSDGKYYENNYDIVPSSLPNVLYENTLNRAGNYFAQPNSLGVKSVFKNETLQTFQQPKIEIGNQIISAGNNLNVTVQDNQITYEQVFTDIDAIYEISAYNLTHKLKINNNNQFATANGNIIFSEIIDLPNNATLHDANGQIIQNNQTVKSDIFIKRNDAVLMSWIAPRIWDNSFQGSPFGEASSYNGLNNFQILNATIEYLGNNQIKYNIEVLASWLNDVSRIYPIYLDPTVTFHDSNPNYGFHIYNNQYPWRPRAQTQMQQFILRQSDIQKSGDIEKISFYHGQANQHTNQNVTIKMKDTGMPEFSSSAFQTFSLDDCGSPSNLDYTSASGWEDITLSTPFNYNDSLNLFIETRFENSSTNYTLNSSIGGVRAVIMPYNATCRGYIENGTSYYPPPPPTGNSNFGDQMPALKLEFSTGTPPPPPVGCAIPSNLDDDGTTLTSADLDWSSVSSANDYTVQYRVIGTSSWITETVSSSSLTINNLIGNTDYEFQVASDCGTTTSNFSSSYTFTTNPPPPPPNPNYVTVQGLTIRGNSVTTNGNLKTVTGNVTIENNTCGNAILSFSNDVIVNTTQEFIYGVGLIKVLNVAYDSDGEFNLYLGAFEFDVVGNKLTERNLGIISTSVEIILASVDTDFESLTITCDAVNAKGSLSLPPSIKTILNNNVDFGYSQLQISQTNGVQVAGNIAFDEVLKIKNVVTIENLYFDYNFIDDEFDGGVEIETKLIDVELGLGIAQGYFNKFELAVDINNAGVPLGVTGLQLTGAGFKIHNFSPISNDLLFIQISGDLKPATGPCTTFCDIAEMTVFGRYRAGTSVELGGDFKLFDRSAAGITYKVTGTGYLTIDATVDLKYIKGFGTLGFNPYPFSASLGAMMTLYPPIDILSGIQPRFLRNIIESKINAPKTSTAAFIYLKPSSSKYYGVAYRDVTFLGFSEEIFYKAYWQNGLKHDFGRGYNNLPSEAKQFIPNPNQNRVQNQNILYATTTNVMRPSASRSTVFNSYFLNNSTKNIFIETTSSGSNYSNIKIYTPKGDTITKNNYTQFENVYYQEETNSNFSFFVINKPIIGDYLIQSNTTDSINIYYSNNRPFINIESIVHNQNNKTIKVNWLDADSDDNAVITLGFDDDNIGSDGVFFKEDISEDSNNNSFTWHYDSIPSGEYYIYTIIQDSIGQFYIDYSKDKYTLVQSNIPNAPTNLTVTATDTSIILNWTNNFVDTPFTNVIYYDGNEVSLNAQSIGVGELSTYELKVPAGGDLGFMVTTVDTSGFQSLGSNVVTVNFVSTTLNNAPRIPTQIIQDIAYIGTNYSHQIQATDADNDVLTYSVQNSPNGFAINNGLINWTPLRADAGITTFHLKVTDIHGDYDSLVFAINVMNDTIARGNLQFNKVLYSDYDDEGIISLYDRDFGGSQTVNDTVIVRLYSDTDTNGIFINLIEIGQRERQFLGSFELSQTTSSNNTIQVSAGDKIWIEYQDNSPNIMIKQYAYFTEYTPNFNFVDSICSGVEIPFFNTSTGDGLKYTWNFGDGTTSTEKHPTHTFEAINLGDDYDTFTVTLSITDNQNRQKAIAKSIQIGQRPNIGLPNVSAACDTVILDIQNVNNTILWSFGATTPIVERTDMGMVYVNVVNAGNICVNDDSTFIDLLNTMQLSETHTPVLCPTGTTTVDLSVNLGLAPFQYEWSDNSTNQDANLPLGWHHVTVTDGNTCQKTDSVLLNDDFVLVANSYSIPANCGTATGSIVVQPSGGISSYNIAWFDNSADTIVQYLDAGNYQVTITDNNNCTITETVNVSYTNVPNINKTVQHLICPDDANGVILLSMNGGTSPYQYNWTDGTTTQNRNSLAGGTYMVSVTDANGCLAEDTIIVREPSGIYANYTEDVDSCGFGNGEIITGISGGTSPYIFFWNNGAITQSLTNIQGGNYILTITDNNGCQKIESFDIETTGIPNALFTPYVIDSVVYFTNNSDNATLSSWDFGNGQNSSNYNTQTVYQTSGSYTITLTVTNITCGLSDTYTQTIYVNLVSTIEKLEAQLQITPNPTTGTIYIQTNDLQNLTCEVFTLQGQYLQTIQLNKDETQLDLSNYADGMYLLKIGNDSGTVYRKIIKH